MSRRAFTMIELVLAVTLGVFIVGAVFGLFSVLRECEKRSRLRADGLHELATLQDALAKSFRTVVVKERVPRARPGSTTGRARPTPATESKAGSDRAGDETPEAEDAGLPGLMLERGGGEGAEGRARLEVVVLATPMAIKLAEEGLDAPGTLIDGEDTGGVRMAFELERGEREGTVDVWLRAYEIDMPPGPDRIPVGQTRVCRGLTGLDVKFWKSGRSEEGEAGSTTPTAPGGLYALAAVDLPDWRTLPEDGDAGAWAGLPAARTNAHLPAYVEVEAQTWQGMRGRWFFEVKWAVAREDEREDAFGLRRSDQRGGAEGAEPGRSGKASAIDRARVTPIPPGGSR